VSQLSHLRSRAYCVLGLVHALEANPEERALLRATLETAVAPIVLAFDQESTPEWTWCESVLTYDNARLAEALLRAGQALGDPRLRERGIAMLDFYAGVVIEDGLFVPVGNDGWYPRNGKKAAYGQQPLEAAAMIDAALAAEAMTPDGVRFLRYAQTAFEWFFGANTAGATLVVNGGCCDGIDPSGVNPNMGAESTLAYLHSAMAIVKPSAARLQIVR
jgi:hypothetical protein